MVDSAVAAEARRAADRLALALEDVGFDVGREFPVLRGAVDRDGRAFVDLGRVGVSVAAGLAGVLERATASGIATEG